MKKIITSICLISILLNILCINAFATNRSESWFAVIKNGSIKFPDNADLVAELGGLYIDTSSAAKEKKIIYLTFDAGYENGNVARILDTLKEKEVPGAFFVLSNLIAKNTDLICRMINEGHTVCNHTKNHKDICKLTDKEALDNLRALEVLFEEKTGNKMSAYFRFPEGRYNEQKLSLLKENGYTTVFWSLAYDDWDDNRQPKPEQAIKKIISKTHDGAVILLHPTSATNAEILPDLIDKWRELGYTFGTLDELRENML